MIYLFATAAQRRPGRRFVALMLALVGVAMLGAGLALPQADAQSGSVSVTPVTCYAIDESDDGEIDNHLIEVVVAANGAFALTDLGVINNGAGSSTMNLESAAFRNGLHSHPIYSFDPSTNSLIQVSASNGADTVQIAVAGLGDIDGLTWRYDDDADASNDELWGIVRNNGNPDQIIGIDPTTGAVLSGPTNIATNGTGQQNNVDSLAWDPTTNTFYASANGPDLSNDLIIISTSGAVTVVGSMGIREVEGLAFTDSGELFGTTGNAGPNKNEFLYVDKATGSAISLGPITLYGDIEGLDCAGHAVVAQPVLDIRLTVIPLGDSCPGIWDAAIEDVGDALLVDMGGSVKWCFNVINTGAGDALNVVVNHPDLLAPLELGTILAGGGEGTGMTGPIVVTADGQTIATVDGTDAADVELPQREDPAAVEVTVPPTATPTPEPTATPTVEPTATPTATPTASPTAEPTVNPTVEPTVDPTVEPTTEPTVEPTASPTAEPTAEPTTEPTVEPTASPTTEPTVDPTAEPTTVIPVEPTVGPTVSPTVNPTTVATVEPTVEPTPTTGPTVVATVAPIERVVFVPGAPEPTPTPGDEVLGIQLLADQPTSALATTGVESPALTMGGLVLLGSGAMLGAGERRRRRLDQL